MTVSDRTTTTVASPVPQARVGTEPDSARPPLEVVLVEDRADDVELIQRALERGNLDVRLRVVRDYAGLDAALAAQDAPEPDLVLTDYSLPGMDVVEVVRRVTSRCPGVPVIVVSGDLDDTRGVDVIRHHGAVDLLLKDRLARLPGAVLAAVAQRDATDRLAAAARNERRSAALLRGLIAHSPTAIGIHVDGRPVVTNPRFDELARAGLTADRVLDRLADGSSAELAHDGRTYLASTFSVSGDDDDPARALLLTDISAQKEVERRLRAVQAELQAESRALLQSNAELQASERRTTDMVDTVTHELRTPVTSILGYTELLRESLLLDDAEDIGRIVQVIERNGARLLDMIANLLHLSALSEAGGGRGATWVNLRDVVGAAGEVLEPLARAAGLEMVLDLPPQAVWVRGDSSQLERVLINLGSNAVKFSTRSSTVRLRLHQEGGPHLEVSDQGMGMSAQDVARLGTRFFRSETADVRRIPGSGLGFAVVADIVRRHGGTVQVDSTPEVGTTISVTLPPVEEAPA